MQFGRTRCRNESMTLRMRLLLALSLLLFSKFCLASCGMVFVNSSEGYQWLSLSQLFTNSPALRLDGFATHRGIVRVKQEPNDGVNRSNRSRSRYGITEEKLFDCLIFSESKLTISDASFGRVLRYLENLSPKGTASAILFDRKTFWLIKAHNCCCQSCQGDVG